MSLVYLDGQYVPASDARITPEDRGFLFGDGVYEVTAVYHGRPFRMGRHVARMARGLSELRIDFDVDGLPEIHRRLIEENGLADATMASVYVQVTRGAAPRFHGFPPVGTPPTVYAFCRSHDRPAREEWERGWGAVTVPDRRWTRVDIKSIALLPNVLACQAAVEAGVKDAIFVRDGMAVEGALNNLFFVFSDTLVTHPATHQILAGITREYLLEVARELDVSVEERPVPVEELGRADEVFFTGTTTEIRPCVEIDGRPVGTGRVGPVTRALYDAFLEDVGSAVDRAQSPDLPDRADPADRDQ